MHQAKRQSERGLESNNAVCRMRKTVGKIFREMRDRMSRTEKWRELVHPLRLGIVWRVIRRNHVGGPVLYRAQNRFQVRMAPKWRIHFCIGSPNQRCGFVQNKMMRRHLTRDIRSMPARRANQ